MNREELNQIAMQVILNAGNARTILNEVIEDLENDCDKEIINKKLKEANDYIVKAHKMQTKVIQGTVTDESFIPDLLFIHAQDTLMTINSELNITKYIVKLWNKK
ncbi:PTS lactose/cellobiose transporter subunit IIA [Breznakia pachnodae]|uniref:PTS system cellobiose-specific IIA component n=1 Tax=Breznakia pachnodae TaxID=265178 RepID=A0ABU0E7Y9_9FIRM|nr:PTS lactose/cellobiose transporter subunit IIA [Breznakia pachnodae]MDQ0363013.1 PTS system cellobiose-specific IIA component [Breznakia pachnodae]